ncbi:MAG: hypothetical protein PHX47_00685 [Candidatus ainarchaeum sp.]|nr:hypothetical protein [Candidatus ainarchaeum sp.]
MNKGILFTIDAIIALLFVGLMGLILQVPNIESAEKILINNRISDLLITSQRLEIDSIDKLEENYIKIFDKKEGYIIINSDKKEINKNSNKYRIISQNIKYINSSNKEIYIEIGVKY